jgi:hypothetical protein
VVGDYGFLIEKLSAMPSKLSDHAILFVGLQTDADDVYILEYVKEVGDEVLCISKSTGKQHWFKKKHLLMYA